MTKVNNFERQFLLSWAENYKYVKSFTGGYKNIYRI